MCKEKNGNTHFSKDDIQMVNKQTKRCPTSLVIKSMQIKATMRSHCTSTRKAKVKNTVRSVGKGVKKLEFPYMTGGNINLKW